MSLKGFQEKVEVPVYLNIERDLGETMDKTLDKREVPG